VAALSAWLGPAEAVWFGVYTYIAAGVMALMVAVAHRYLGQAIRNIWLLLTHWSVAGIRPMRELTLEESKGPRLAYAAPVLVGTLITLWKH
jgi:Flp pilus assembly protein protease CpaA